MTEPRPIAWMWQHEETGRTGFVDCWQVDNGWQAQNPRLHLISPLYAAAAPELAALRKDAARYRWLRDRKPGGMYRIAGLIYSDGNAAFDAAIDAAMAAEVKT